MEYSFMKSGSGAGEVPSNAPDFDSLDPLLQSTMLLFLRKAIRSSGEYATAANRRTIHAEDVVRCLKYHALPSGQFWSTPQMQQRLGEARQQWLDAAGPAGPAGPSEHVLRAELPTGGGAEATSASEDDEAWCAAADDASPLAAAVNRASEDWGAWHPGDAVGIVLKRAIDRVCDRFSV